MRWSNQTGPPYAQNGGGQARTRPWVAPTIVVHQEGCEKAFERSFGWPLCSCGPDIVGYHVTFASDGSVVFH